MILPVTKYGDKILRTVGEIVPQDYPNLNQLINNMYQTMDVEHGIGIAAQQISLPLLLFVVNVGNFKRTFINAKIINQEGEEWGFYEGCLSVKGIGGLVFRKPMITVEYCEEDFIMKTETFIGIQARVIQHEFDHIQGILFIDKMITTQITNENL